MNPAVSDSANALRELARAHLWHPYTPASAVDEGLPVIVAGEGPWLVDADGRRWLDAIASWWACALGHGHPAVVEAIRRQAAELDHCILGGLIHPRAAELAARLACRMPEPRVHVHFASDGASAVEAAVKIALQFHVNRGVTERTELLALENAYHGDTLAAVGLGFLEGFHAPFRPVVRPAVRLPVPYGGRDLDRCVAAARDAFASRRGRVAAVVVEPLCQGAAGMRMYPAGYLAALSDLARHEGALLIADEIATGFGRTGRWFAFEHADVTPDIVCLGKALSGGTLPISAAVVRDEVYATFAAPPPDRTFHHGHTFAGNPIAAAAALASLDVYEAEDLPGRAARMGVAMKERLAALHGAGGVADVRCLGLIGAVEFDGPARVRAVRDRLWARRILARPLGPVVYLMPPLNIAPDLLDHACSALVEAVRAAG